MPFLVTLGEMLFNSQMRDAWDADWRIIKSFYTFPHDGTVLKPHMHLVSTNPKNRDIKGKIKT